MRIPRIARRLAFAAGAGACFLALTAFTLPLPPVPAASPQPPLPLPSVPALFPNSGGSGQTQQSTTPPSEAAPAPAAKGQGPTLVPAAAPGSVAAPARTVTPDDAVRTQVSAARSEGAAVEPVSLPPAGGGPGAPGGPTPPLAWLLAAFAAGAVILVRRLDIQLLPMRRGRVLLTVAPAVPEALDAAICLCESMLPAGTTVERGPSGVLQLRTARGQHREVDEFLARMSQRARRVGLELTWTSTAPRLPAGDRLVPA